MPDIYRLKGQVKHYDWGGSDFIPGLLGVQNSSNQPFAEYWMGIHPQGSSLLVSISNEEIPLAAFEPELPFLLKVLDVNHMLSIQVHPTKDMARADYDRENMMGIPLDSPIRNYKDPNHKPELMVALSEFWLLHGFRPYNSLIEVLNTNSFLRPIKVKFEKLGLAGLYRWIMELPQEAVNRMLSSPVLEMLESYRSGRLEKSDPCFWAARAVDRSGADIDMDRGIFSIFLFNLVQLKRGQAIFQGAGVPHAYLEGQNVEIMANSDNVLRGGLTPKHIDVPELLRHVRATEVIPQVIDPVPDEQGFCKYPVPVGDFCLQSIQLTAGQSISFRFEKSSLLLLPEGALEISSNQGTNTMGVGAISYFSKAGTAVQLSATQPCFLFMASAGLPAVN